MKELFRLAESHETAAHVGVASGLAVFEAGVRSLDVTKQLFARAFENDAAQRAIGARIADLVEEEIDSRYLHPHDTPLAIYLWLLDRLEADVARLAAASVFQARNCFWAYQIARQTYERQELAPGVTFVPAGSASSHDGSQSVELRIATSDVRTLRSQTRGRWSLGHVLAESGAQVTREVPLRDRPGSWLPPASMAA